MSETAFVSKRRPLAGVQMARGVAAIIVVLAHANLLIARTAFGGWFVEGYCGVDFFFVLSGFIIFYANGRDIGKPGRLPLYTYKRFVRIFPIYWFYSIILLMLNFAIFRLLHKELIGWTDVTPKTILQCFTLFPTDVAHNVMPFLPVAWTLSYELLFYIVFASLIFFPRKIAAGIFLSWMLACLISLIFGYHYSTPPLAVLLSPKNLEFLFGGGVAYLSVRKLNAFYKAYWPTLIFALCALALAWVNVHMKLRFVSVDNTIAFGIPFALIVFSVVGLELSQSDDERGWQRPLMHAGDASYSIYLVHFIVLCLFKVSMSKMGIGHSYLQFFFICPATILIGMICYRIFERPILEGLNKRYLPKLRASAPPLSASKLPVFRSLSL